MILPKSSYKTHSTAELGNLTIHRLPKNFKKGMLLDYRMEGKRRIALGDVVTSGGEKVPSILGVSVVARRRCTAWVVDVHVAGAVHDGCCAGSLV